MLRLSGLKARILLQLLIPLVTWSVVNVTAEVNDFHLISLDPNRVSREEVCELSVEIVADLLWGGYLRVVKSDCFVLSLGRQFAIHCLDSFPQFCGFVL